MQWSSYIYLGSVCKVDLQNTEDMVVVCCHLVGSDGCSIVTFVFWVVVGQVPYGVVWFGLAWFGMVWYGLVWFGMVWHGLVWHGMVWYDMV